MSLWSKLAELVLGALIEWVCEICDHKTVARKTPKHCGKPMKPLDKEHKVMVGGLHIKPPAHETPKGSDSHRPPR